MLKKDRLVVTQPDDDDWETLLRSHTVQNVQFSSTRAKLSRLVAASHGFIKVQNRQAGDFLAISVDEMNKFLTELMGSQGQKASFFDGMDEFESGSPIPYSTVTEMDAAAPEYTDEDIESLRARIGANQKTRAATE